MQHAAANKPPDQPAVDAFHPRQRIFTDPVKPTHLKQTLINPKAPFEPPKLLPDLPNVVQFEAVAPPKPRLLISEEALKKLHPNARRVKTVTTAPPLDAPNMEQRVTADMSLPSVQNGPARPKLEINASAAPRVAQRAQDGDATPAPDVAAGQPNPAGGAASTLIALSATPGPPAPVAPPAGNLAARVAIAPEAPKPGSGAADAAGGGGKSTVGVSISGGNPKSNSGISGLGGPNAAPTPKIAVPSARAMINKPQPQTTDDEPVRTGPPDFSALAPGAKPEAIFATKRVYTMNVNMPNLNSATGSWILNFSELRSNPDAPHITSTDLAGPVPLRKVETPARWNDGAVTAAPPRLREIVREWGRIGVPRLRRAARPHLDAARRSASSAGVGSARRLRARARRGQHPARPRLDPALDLLRLAAARLPRRDPRRLRVHPARARCDPRALGRCSCAGSPPRWVRGAGWARAPRSLRSPCGPALDIGLPALGARTLPERRARVAAYALAGGVVAALTGPWLVLVILVCGADRAGVGAGRAGAPADLRADGWPLLAAASDPGGIGSLVWTALKVGALSFGGGFVIVPLMQADAVGAYHWMTHEQFLNAVALGQVTPGPLVQTVAAVGYAAGGVGWGLLAALRGLPALVLVHPDRRRGASSACSPTAAPSPSWPALPRLRPARSSGSALPLALAIGQRLAGAAARARRARAAVAAPAGRADAARLRRDRRARGARRRPARLGSGRGDRPGAGRFDRPFDILLLGVSSLTFHRVPNPKRPVRPGAGISSKDSGL